MGASPTPMAFGEVYTSLQTGVIDGYEHDASTTLQQRFYEVARSHGAHASHRRRARSVRVQRGAGAASARRSARRSSRRRLTRPDEQRAMGPREDAAATDAARGARHDDPGHRRRVSSGRPPNGCGNTEARALDVDAVARGDPRVTSVHGGTAAPLPPARIARSSWSIAVLVVAQAAVVGLQVVGRHVLRQPIPWTEEIARLLLGWLMCVGGISALRHGQHPRVTALVRLSPGAAAAGGRSRPAPRAAGGFFLWLVVPGMAADGRQRARAAAGERPVGRGDFRGPAGRARADGRPCSSSSSWRDGTRGVARPNVARVVARRGRRWRSRRCSCRCSLDAAPLVVLVTGFLVTAALGVPLAFTLALTSLTYLLGIGGVEPDHPADQDSRRRRLVRPARDPALHPRRRADGVGRHLRAHRRSRDGDRRPRPRRARDGRGRRGDPLLGHLGIDRGGRVGDQLAARAVDAASPAIRDPRRSASSPRRPRWASSCRRA